MSIYRGAGGAGDAVNDSSSEATLIQQLAIEAQDSADAAATSETNAAASETAAASSASAASTSASNAATSATNASNSASSASTSATNAANSATAAQTAETAAELAETNAETAETNAETAASAASTSASNAATSATNASNSASSASTSATNASNSASAASTSASNASTSATAAAGSASSASTSASNASTSATNAASSASSASTSATTATTQAGIATTQATNAASSASAASTSATNASNSASSASTSATSAANAQSAAETARDQTLAAFDSFDDRYLGQKSTAPTVDNDGNALLAGALYFNTTTNEMKVYDGSIWLNAYASLSGALLATNNLSDLNNTATARTNLGVAIGTDVQAYDSDLTAWAGVSTSAKQDTLVSGTNLKTVNSSSLLGSGNLAVGTVTNVTGTSPLSSSGGTTPAISLAASYGDTQNPYASKTANFVLAAPNGTAGVPTFRAVVAADIPTLNQNTTGTASNVTGTVAIANGGTGATTRQNAMDALAGAVTSGQYLRGNGTDVVMSAIQAADVPTLNQNTTGSAATLTTGRTIAITGDLAYTSPSFNGSANVTAAGTLATVNSNTGSFGSSTAIPVITVNGKGLVTAVSTATVAGGQYFGSASVKAIAYNANTIGENVTVTAGNNGLSAGPITISNGFTVTVQTGAAWVIV